jgi:hypothetical protein
MSKIAGTCYIKADGEQFEVSGGVEVPVMNVKREAVMSLGGVSGFKETANKPFIKFTGNVPKEFPIAKLQESTDMTITAELANGTVYTLSGAFVEGEPSIKADEGTVDLEFAGMKGIWQ